MLGERGAGEEPALAVARPRGLRSCLVCRATSRRAKKKSAPGLSAIAATAPQAAGVIHTDFERGFIKAEVYTIGDLLELGSEAAMKAAGRLRIEGKEYVVQDGDVMHFRFNV